MSTLSALDAINSLSLVDALAVLAKHGIYPPAPYTAGAEAVRQVVRRAYEQGHIPNHTIMEYSL